MCKSIANAKISDEELYKYLSKMEVPKHRYDHFNKVNIEWLYKNLSKRNKDKDNFDLAYSEIEHRYNNKIYNS